MELFRIIKSDAKRAMHFCGGRSVASAIIILLACLMINLAESALLLVFSEPGNIFENLYGNSPESIAVVSGMAFVWLLLIPALFLGYKKLHFSFAEGKDESISVLFDMFSSFKKFIGSFFFAFAYIIRYAVVFSFAILPGGAFLWFSEKYIPENGRTSGIIKISACCIAISIIILCVFLAIIFVQRWSLAGYYKISGNGIFKSFSLSAKATKGLCTRIIAFKCSFIGWGFLSPLILPLFWSVPYYGLSMAIFSKYLMERYEHSLAEVPFETEAKITFAEEN